MFFAGIDIGSITAKAALIKENELIGTLIVPTGYDHLKAGRRVYEALLNEAGITEKEVEKVVSTGYGRKSISFADRSVTEILCHGTGAHFLNPEIRGVIDVGGQDSKAIRLDDDGQVSDFAMNDKCAAGTGRFLEVMANAMDVKLDEMGLFDERADNPSKISSICTVFAESEVISMIARQEKRENIIAGIHDSAAARVAILARKVKLVEPVMMTGGVAKNMGVVNALNRHLGITLDISALSQANGAIGAAVMASRS